RGLGHQPCAIRGSSPVGLAAVPAGVGGVDRVASVIAAPECRAVIDPNPRALGICIGSSYPGFAREPLAQEPVDLVSADGCEVPARPEGLTAPPRVRPGAQRPQPGVAAA